MDADQLKKLNKDKKLVKQLAKKNDENKNEIDRFPSLCKDNNGVLNVTKTKDMITDFHTSKQHLEPEFIDGEEVQDVEEYKYLGTLIDNTLTRMETVDSNQNYLRRNSSGNSVHKPGTDLSEIVTMACLEDRCDVLEARLQGISKSDINLQDTAGMTALHFAVAQKKVEAVNLLLNHGADVNAADDHGFTPLFLATGRYADYDVALTLLQKLGIIVNCINYNGATPLHGAAHAQNPDCVRLLIRHGACTTAKCKDGATPLDLCGDHMETIAALKTTRCVECGKQPITGLKTCGQCQGPLYCSKECQRKHWKEGGHKTDCGGGFVWAEPYTAPGTNSGWVSTISLQNMSVSTTSTTHMKLSKKNITKERFIVKVQLPLSYDNEQMMVYNKDRSLTLLISPDHQQKAFRSMARKIQSDGFMGLKAFFWAELINGPELKVKVYHSKCAPFQEW